MSIMPREGWEPKVERPPSTLSAASADRSCPTCHSIDWKAASLIHREGLSVLSSQTRGVAMGVARMGLRGGRTAVGGSAYRGKTSGVTQTVLSQMAAPPQRRMALTIFLAILFVGLGWSCVAGVLDAGISLSAVVMGSFMVVLIWAVGAAYRRETKLYYAAMYVYEGTRMCLRCGAFYAANPLQTYDEDPAKHGVRDRNLIGFGACAVILILFGAAVGHTSPHAPQFSATAPSDVTGSAPPIQPSISAANDVGSSDILTQRDLSPFEASDAELLSAYESDSTAASVRYYGRVVTITGTLTGVFIPSIETSMRLADKGGATAFATMGGPKPSTPGQALFLPGIHASSVKGSLFGERDPGEDLPISVGMSITLRCTVGKSSKASDLTGNGRPGTHDAQLMLDDCTMDHSGESAESGLTNADTQPQAAGSSQENTHVAPIVRMPPPENPAGSSSVANEGDSVVLLRTRYRFIRTAEALTLRFWGSVVRGARSAFCTRGMGSGE
jgi:hypothetical protein